MDDQNSNREEPIHDVDDIFHVEPKDEVSPTQEYRGNIVVDDDDYLGTVNNVEKDVAIIVPKITFVHLPKWKAYIKLSLYVRSGNGRHGLANEVREPTDLHQAHVYLGRGCVLDIKIERVTRTSVVPDFPREKLLMDGLDQGLVYELRVTYDPNRLRQHGFTTSIIGERIYSDLVRVRSLLYSDENPVFRMLINTNDHVIDVIDDFRQHLDSITPNYARFYPKHPDQHFLQSGDYPLPHEWSTVCIPATATFDDWSEYTTVLGYAAIYEHEVAEKMAVNISEAIFRQRVMNVPFSRDRHYIGFLEPEDELDARFNPGDRLKINFDLERRLETEDWTAVVLEALPCAPQGDVSIAIFRRWDEVADDFRRQRPQSLTGAHD